LIGLLKETGKVQKDQFEAIAKATLNDGFIIFNAREVDFDDATNDLCWRTLVGV